MINEFDDDYLTPGKSLAELYGLDEDDPWKSEDSDEKKMQDKLAQKQTEFFDKLRKEGVIQEQTSEKEEEFVDPPDDEDRTVAEKSSMTVFWRMVVPNRKLSEIIGFDVAFLKVAFTAKNNLAGCWVVFTSGKIAKRITTTLVANGIPAEVYLCDIKGNLISKVENKVVVTGSRPWMPISEPNGNAAANEFFYCLADYDGTIKVFFVPENYWNERQQIFDGDLGITDMLKGRVTPTALPYCYTAWRDMSLVKQSLDCLGFRENLIFQAYVNEQGL